MQLHSSVNKDNIQTSLCSASYVSCINVTLLAFAADRRAAAPLLLSADRAAINRYLLPAGVRRTNVGTDEQTDERTDRQTDRRTPDRYIDPAQHTM